VRGPEGKRIENGILARLVSVNLFNGFAIGLTGPLISYWFAQKFGVGPSTLGPTFAITFVVTGIASLITGRVSTSIGVVRSVVWARMVGLALLVVLPLLPVYWLAAVIYLLRSALNRGTAGARQALAIGLVGDERRGLASSLNTVSMQLPQSAGPTVAGLLLDAGQLALPFYVAAVLQGLYLVFYRTMFRKYEPSPSSPRQGSANGTSSRSN
jgi:MFS family permease